MSEPKRRCSRCPRRFTPSYALRHGGSWGRGRAECSRECKHAREVEVALLRMAVKEACEAELYTLLADCWAANNQ